MNLLSNRARHYHTEAFADMVADINELGVDHALCTGDVTNLALRQEFEYARVQFDRLALPPSEVTVVPGNHDAYVAEGVAHFAEIFAPFTTSDAAYGAPQPASWPLVRVRGHVAIVGVCTSHSTPWFTAYGTIGAAQLRRLDDVLARLEREGLVVVIALHHPPAGRRAANAMRGLRDHAAFAGVIARHRVAVILHGHEHRDMAERLPTRDGHVSVLGVPSGTYEAGDPAKAGQYRVLEISARGEIQHTLRRWVRNDRRFIDGVGHSV